MHATALPTAVTLIQPAPPPGMQDCRPKGVSDKLARGDADTVDATLHTSERMVRQVYDRRRIRVAKPAG
jgi:hypothetical protein